MWLTLHRYQSKPIHIITRRWDPVTAGSSSLLGLYSDVMSGATGIFSKPFDEYKRSREDGSSSSNAQVAGNMALASAKSIGRVNASLFKGTMLDMPLAMAEGFRATPKLYGVSVPDHEPITDWKSGAKVAGKVCCISVRCPLIVANTVVLRSFWMASVADLTASS